MSNNPFRDSVPEDPFSGHGANPYQPPTELSEAGSATAGSKVKVPAIILLVLASSTIPLYLIQLPRIIAGAQEKGPSYLVGALLTPLMNLAVLCGAIQMLRLKSYSSAMTAAVLSVIPFCSPCIFLGIPFGIWAIVVLRDPLVKRAFR